ncbi:MAG: hypothetical protein Q9226_004131 [Calogaya cf. arnoldii]
MSTTQTAPENGPDVPKGPQGMHQEPDSIPKETRARTLKRKGKSVDLSFEKVWGEGLDKKVSEELHKLVLEVRQEYTEGEELPSEDAIAYTHFAKSWSELRKAMRAKEKTKLKRHLASRDRDNHEKQMESIEPLFTGEERQLRSGRRIRCSGGS